MSLGFLFFFSLHLFCYFCENNLFLEFQALKLILDGVGIFKILFSLILEVALGRALNKVLIDTYTLHL